MSIEYGTIQQISPNRERGLIRAGGKGNPIESFLEFEFTRRARVCRIGPEDRRQLVWTPVDHAFRPSQIYVGSRVVFERQPRKRSVISNWAEREDCIEALMAVNTDLYVITLNNRWQTIVWQGSYTSVLNQRIDSEEGTFPTDMKGKTLYIVRGGGTRMRVSQQRAEFSILWNADRVLTIINDSQELDAEGCAI